ncbi:hypothetical protein LTR95_011218 [Oleoguttula sp. CCFEE 5521]
MASSVAGTSPDLDLVQDDIQVSASSASGKVFYTPELLEAILLYLPRLDVLLLKCIDSTFRNVVDGPAVRQHSLLEHARGAMRDRQTSAFLAAHAQPDENFDDSDSTHIGLDWAPLLAQSRYYQDDLEKDAPYSVRLYDHQIMYTLWYRHSVAQVEGQLRLPQVDHGDFDHIKLPPIRLKKIR